jgi:hypothetical protein
VGGTVLRVRGAGSGVHWGSCKPQQIKVHTGTRVSLSGGGINTACMKQDNTGFTELELRACHCYSCAQLVLQSCWSLAWHDATVAKHKQY